MGLLFDTIANAARLAPVLTTVLPILDRGLTGQPVSRADGDWLFYALQAAEMVVPDLAPLVPIVRKKFVGEVVGPEDHEAAKTAADAIAALMEATGPVAAVTEPLRNEASPVPPLGFVAGLPRTT